MANRISQLLSHWTENRDKHLWVLATIIETDGSSYRKAGAMMLINDMGQYFGLLSGGCLESDIMRQARRCWDSQKNRIIEYDMREEEDLAWQLGIGCGGMVRILLQPVHRDNDYLKLEELNRLLEQRQQAEYHQLIDEDIPFNQVVLLVDNKNSHTLNTQSKRLDNTFVQLLSPAPLLAVFGAGVDAKPVVSIAAELGWQVILVDPRVGYAKAEFFPKASQIIRSSLDELLGASWLYQIDVALILTHNIKLDAAALKLVQSSSAKYVGLLGPTHRTDRVLDFANLSRNNLTKSLANPVGLRLGGELPESIALSMLSEAHAVLERADGLSISGVFTQ
jgi:xanthine/CO dehydrogenase XdhC/CoxF family maturation factor